MGYFNVSKNSVISRLINNYLLSHKVIIFIALLMMIISAGATGGSTDQVFYENDQVVTTNYTISTNKNAMTAGPITVNSGVTVTIPTGSEWSIV